ncbi:MAG: BrnT family toxin [Burkholderiales bacterium]|nr:BrnT family toxin [Burkholderiales bacterium]MDE1926730.1 BrnT family toxin [Burkholderiales bacterium]MDE2504102.1 BrnT family toxin [Burkholderiales bacterium]
MKIEWDLKKAEANLREHGVALAEAATVLTDDYAMTREDPDAVGEQRFVSLGMSATGALLVVVFTHREPDIYRLISSWKANRPQRKQYEKSRR